MANEQKFSMFDPSKKAYCELDMETAKKFVDSAKKVEEQIKKVEGEKPQDK